MTRLKADYIITMNSEFEIIENGEVLFDNKILKIGHFESDIPSIYLGKNSVIMPGLINTHTHLEFSANNTTLEYGDFMKWLNSVIDNREDLLMGCKDDCYKKAINQMKKSGIVAFGEISSTGEDLKHIKNCELKVVHFNEIIGSNPAAVDALYQDFLGRLSESKKHNSDKFKASVSIHSPFSVHPIVVKKVIELAKEDDMTISAHFLESPAEREWLENSKGDFKVFFQTKLNQSNSFITPMEFLELFRDVKTHYIHAVQSNENEFQEISNQNASIAHCPISNRLLNAGLLDLERVKNLSIPFTVATDGLSSNYSLNLFKELRNALFMHTCLHPKYLAKDLLKAVTINASDVLGFDNGSIEIGKDADLISFKLPNKVKDLELLPLQIILHTNEVDQNFVNGKKLEL
jgi:cytosine/adenosine deaminase-related metal-dependent hydrolase